MFYSEVIRLGFSTKRNWLLLVGSFLLTVQAGIMVSVQAQTPVPLVSQPGYSYTATFADVANWTDNFASGIEANRWASVPVSSTGTTPNPNIIVTATNTFVSFSSGGVYKGGAGNIALVATGTTDNTNSAAIDFFVNFTGLNANRLQFDAITVTSGTAGANRKGTLKVYASTDGTTFTDLGVDYVATNNTSGSATLSVSLPASFNNSATARLRFYYFNGGTPAGNSGARPRIAIDNVQVSGAALSVTPASLTGLNATCSTPSAAQAYTLTSATSLTATIAVNAPAGFEVSQTSNVSGFAATQNVVPSGGTVNQVLYVRRKSGLTAGSVSSAVSVTNTSPQAFLATVALSGSTTAAPTPNVSTTAVTCLGGNDGVLSVSATGGLSPYSFTFSTGHSATNGLFTGLVAGTYSVSLSDANGCSSVVTNQAIADGISFTIATQNTTICSGISADLTALVTAYNTYTNQVWHVGSPSGAIVSTPGSVTPGVSTIYYLVAQGPQSCTAQATVSVTVRQSPSVQITAVNVGCSGNQTQATIQTQVLGGAPPIGYSWTRSGISGVVSTAPAPSFTVTDSFTVVVTDANSCTGFASVNVATPNPLASSLQLQQPLCSGSEGVATLTLNGGSGEFSIDYTLFGETSPVTTVTAAQGIPVSTSLSPGSYSITITDSNLECILSLTATLTDPPALSLTVSGTDLLCNGAATGALSSTTAGGTPFYSYAWNNGASTASLNSLTAGSYSLTVTDANGCTSSQAMTLTQPTALSSGTATITNIKCLDALTGAISLTGTSGGVGPYNFTLTGGTVNTTGSFTGLAAGVYTITLSDANSCTASVNALSVTQPTDPPDFSFLGSGTNTLTCSGTLLLETRYEQSNYMFYGPGIVSRSASTIIIDKPGTYTATATVDQGCPATAITTVISDTEAPSISISPTDVTVCDGTTLTASGSFSTLIWSTGTTTNDIIAHPSILYSVTATGANGCTAVSNSSSVTVNALPTATLSASPNATITCVMPSVTLVAGTGSSYVFTNSSGTPISSTGNEAVVTVAGTYSVIVTSNGCSSTTSIVINLGTGPSGLTLGSPATASAVCEGGSVVVPVSVSGTATGFQWYQNGSAVAGQTSATLALGGVQSGQAGNYILVATSSCGSVTTTSSFILTVGSQPTVVISFPSSSSTLGLGIPTITISPDVTTYQVTGGVLFERIIVIDRINGYEIREVEANNTGLFAVSRLGLFTMRVTDSAGCQRTVQGILR